MTEGLFILTTIFVAYVVYVINGDSKAKKKAAAEAASAPKKKAATKPKAAAKPKPKPAAKSTEKPAAAKASAAKPAPAPAPAEAVSNELKNPKTGEVAALSSNYRFTKRWIKDALVEEGLLEKVYKGNEIDDATTKKISAAFEKIKTMKKYQA